MPNFKFQTNSNDQNFKFQTVWNLMLGICDLFGNWLLVICIKKRIFRFTQRSESGQGLLEAIVAIAIIVGGIVGVMNLVISNQTSGFAAADRLLAANLAREGVEIIRNIRDSNWLARDVWDKGLENGSDYTVAPMFDKNTNQWTLGTEGFMPNNLDHAYTRVWREGGVYFQSTQNPPSGAIDTLYRRLITLDEICRDKTIVSSGSACNEDTNPKIGIRIKSEVQWSSRGGIHNLKVEERIFNWR